MHSFVSYGVICLLKLSEAFNSVQDVIARRLNISMYTRKAYERKR